MTMPTAFASSRRTPMLLIAFVSYLMIVLDISIDRHHALPKIQLGGSLGLGILVAVFTAAQSAIILERALLAHRGRQFEY